MGWLVAALSPVGPYPLLALVGEQGSGKTTTARLLKSIVDPEVAIERAPPRNEQDLFLAARRRRVVVLDNVSKLSCKISDALCRLSTGGTFATRRHYSDNDEAVHYACRPVLATGIGGFIERADLRDRAIVISLPPVRKRRTEMEIAERFEALRPRLLGALCDALCAALRHGEEPRFALGRMADAEKWIWHAEAALPWKPGSFHEALVENAKRGHANALDVDPVAQALLKLLDAGPPRQGCDAQRAVRATARTPHAGGAVAAERSTALRRPEPPRAPPPARRDRDS